jgi:hypothetical protein
MCCCMVEWPARLRSLCAAQRTEEQQALAGSIPLDSTRRGLMELLEEEWEQPVQPKRRQKGIVQGTDNSPGARQWKFETSSEVVSRRMAARARTAAYTG